MMALEKIYWGQIGIGLIFQPVSTAEFVSKFVRLKVRFYLKKDPIYKALPNNKCNRDARKILPLFLDPKSSYLALE
jgi:hypothetical protein